MNEWSDYVNRARAKHGDKLDLSAIAEKFLPYFRGPRIKVQPWYQDDTITGTVGVTTGWQPSLLLMRRSSDHGSSILLDDRFEVVAVQHGRQYRDA